MQHKDWLLGCFMDRVDDFFRESSFFNSWTINRVTLPIAAKFIGSFDSLVLSFPSIIALGVAGTDDEDTRVVLATNLYQECGQGDVSRTHHAIFQKFVSSAQIECKSHEFPSCAEQWRSSMREYILDSECYLRALGAMAAGEFLAQPALSRIFSVIERLYPTADVEYFTSHLELETEHVREIAALLSRQIERGANESDAVVGFNDGLAIWRVFFESMSGSLFADAQAPHVGASQFVLS